MKKSKLAIASFVLSLMPIILPVMFSFWTLINLPGTHIQTVAPLEIVGGEVVGGGGITDTGKVVSATDIGNSGVIRAFNSGFFYIFFYSIFATFWFAILAIVLGIVALIKIKRNNLRGKWFAIVGMVISIVLVVTMIVLGSITSWGAHS